MTSQSVLETETSAAPPQSVGTPELVGLVVAFLGGLRKMDVGRLVSRAGAEVSDVGLGGV